VWPIILSDQLRIFGLVGSYSTNYLILRKLILQRLLTFPKLIQNLSWSSKIQTTFLLGLQGRFLRVTHPFATPLYGSKEAFNLHVLSFSLAFILSQDQTHTNFSFIFKEEFFFTGQFFEKKKEHFVFVFRNKNNTHFFIDLFCISVLFVVLFVYKKNKKNVLCSVMTSQKYKRKDLNCTLYDRHSFFTQS
jgi:hypothetical protein